MRNILIPIDFSDCANEALKVGIELGKRFEAQIHLLHMAVDIQFLPDAETGSVPEINLSRDALEQIRAKYPEVSSQAVCFSGTRLQEIIREYVEKHGIDLIVMGSHGVSGKSEYFIGSQTQKVVRTVRCPVLVVKKAPAELKFERVVFASGFNENEKEVFLKFKEFVKHFIPEIHLVAIQTSVLFEAPYIVTREAMEDFRALCHPFKCEVHIHKEFTIDQGVRNFADILDADLIAISNRYRHPLKRMLLGSNVEALINHADIPVLSIDYPDEQSS